MLRIIGLLFVAGCAGCGGEVATPSSSGDRSATPPVTQTETLIGKWTATMPEPDTPAVSWHFHEGGRGVLSLGEEQLGEFDWQETTAGKIEIRMDDLSEDDATRVDYKFIRGELVLTGPQGTTRFARSASEAPAQPESQPPAAEEKATANPDAPSDS